MPDPGLDVDPDGVRAAGATAGAAARSAPAAPITITPCAADATSVRVASRLAGRIGALNAATASANLITGAAAELLRGTADAYAAQDAAGAGVLRSQPWADGGGVVVPARAAVAQMPAAPEMPAFPAGVEPTTGSEISALMHSGPGPQGLLVTAYLLDAQADLLDAAADTVAAARLAGTQSWHSPAAVAADAHLQTLQAAYTGQASQARSLARAAVTQANNFARAKAAIPPPQVFADLEVRLHAAYAANAHPTSLGRYTGLIEHWQHELATANDAARSGYKHYERFSEIDAGAVDPELHPEPPAASPPASDGTAPPGPGGQDGTAHPGHDQTHTPMTLPSGPAALGGESATALTQLVLPAVLGALSGASGGVLGALSGAGGQLQQAGSQLAGAVAQGFGQAMNAGMGEQPPADSTGPGGGSGSPSGGFDDPAPGGGGDLGGTEPASAPGGAGGALAPPVGMSAAPAAAPAAVGGPVGSVTGATVGAPVGGGVVPPMMPMAGRPGAGGSEQDRRLYPERRMRIETPPNAEPVKGRREPRRVASGQAGEGDPGR